MENSKSNHDEKIIFDLNKLPSRYKAREIVISKSGDKFGAILLDMEDGGYFLMENGEIINNEPWDNAWNLTYSPEDILFAFISKMGMWYLFKDREQIGEYEYLWDLMFNDAGSYAVAIKKNSQYGMLVNGREWEQLHIYAMDFTLAKLSPNTSACAQTRSIDEKDVTAFKEGTFSLIKDGKIVNGPFTNVRCATISPDGKRVAAVIRDSNYKYGIIEDDTQWEEKFTLVWDPIFHPVDNSLFAAVRKKKYWFLYKDGEILWKEPFMQLWHLSFSENGKVLAGICSKKFGKFTVCVDGECWSKKFPVVEKILINKDGTKVLAVVNKEYPSLNIDETVPTTRKQIFLNNREASEVFDRIMYPSFSPQGKHFVAVVEKKGTYYIIIDGNVLDIKFSMVWEPIFIKENEIIIKGIINNKIITLIKTIGS